MTSSICAANRLPRRAATKTPKRSLATPASSVATEAIRGLAMWAEQVYQPCLVQQKSLPHLSEGDISRWEFWTLLAGAYDSGDDVLGQLSLRPTVDGLHDRCLAIQDSLTAQLAPLSLPDALEHISAIVRHRSPYLVEAVVRGLAYGAIAAPSEARLPTTITLLDLKASVDATMLMREFLRQFPCSVTDDVSTPFTEVMESSASAITCRTSDALVTHLQPMRLLPWSVDVLMVALRKLIDMHPTWETKDVAAFVVRLPAMPPALRRRAIHVILAHVGLFLRYRRYDGLDESITGVSARWQEFQTQVQSRLERHTTKPLTAVPRRPDDLIAAVDRIVIGMTQAKRSLALRLSLQARSLTIPAISAGGVIVLAGPTGVGKTLLLKTLAEEAGLPFAHINAPSMVPEGIIGPRIQDLGRKLLSACGRTYERAERGVIFLDEFDKLPDAHYANDVLTQLLTLMGGGQFDFFGSRDSDTLDGRSLPAGKILWVLGGTFARLMPDVANSEVQRMGFQTTAVATSAVIDHAALMHAGLAREVVGRIDQVLTVSAHSAHDLERILVESAASPLLLTQAIVTACGANITLEDGVIHAIAERALAMGIGARGLKAIVNALFESHVFAAANQDHYRGHISHADVSRLAA